MARSRKKQKVEFWRNSFSAVSRFSGVECKRPRRIKRAFFADEQMVDAKQAIHRFFGHRDSRGYSGRVSVDYELVGFDFVRQPEIRCRAPNQLIGHRGDALFEVGTMYFA